MNARAALVITAGLWVGGLGLLSTTVQAAEPATATVITTRISPIDQAEMVLVPAGPFIYGEEGRKLRQLLSDRLQAAWAPNYASEAPRQTRNLPSFYIDRFEVSNARYSAFLRAQSGHRASRYASYPQFNAPDQPVVGIGWSEAAAFCAWAGKRLPSEEEWEKAARGTDGRLWPWGDALNEASFNGRSAGVYNPAPVGSHRSSDSPYGAADMAGNVCEMTATPWDATPKHVMRGGSFLNRLPDVRTTVRWATPDEDNGTQWLGFRCASAVKP
ncbi:MAG: formylglycine-generating enzyme family protein [Leptothrix ochracea]|uniref:formylglycine-generating enzyme family protein n=1 Tax=Leptothrix ochracea TaxID=735331 RepID=UPI0034E1DB08